MLGLDADMDGGGEFDGDAWIEEGDFIEEEEEDVGFDYDEDDAGHCPGY